ncbi:aldo/keto reductase [Ammoniphilus resinae]|uniref:Diketogulonate reductase-like aldo/keto reductase n=1 Tax=Ammoniphilus resinae TaxID=861532 RepID=A0ABS4GW82_9BACL|nr:aldo/keto reductase [Ammoniphilus resinae]MBP1934506.1 diketogulonate reductase-like aldo/keto reductase [Ammoniphilus resinae]
MLKDLRSTTRLNNGVEMPWLGLGVFKVKEGEEVYSSVKHAIQYGYKSIDTAAVYGNEEGVGKAIRESGIPREQLFITTKVWNANQGYDSTLQAFEDSRKKLGLDYLDLYLIHWPVKEKYKETWKALEKLYKDGSVRAIGVSNFHIHHLQDLLADCEVVPAVNQVECHPQLTQKELQVFCQEQKIQMEAWSPLMQGNLDVPLLTELSQKYNKTAAQIVLRWDLQRGIVTIPKSITPHRIEENANVFDFELSTEDIERIDALNANHRYGPDPDNFNF